MNLQIKFKKSRSKNFSVVMERCGDFDLFTEGDSYCLKIVSLEELYQKWDSFNLIYHYTKQWRGTYTSYDGTVSRTNDLFYSLQELKGCYKQYREHNNRQTFCDSSDWGCHKLKSIHRYVDTSYGPYWYDFGFFKSNFSMWVVDKERLLNALIEEARQKKAFDCPIFNINVVKGYVQRLPEVIFIDGQSWEVDYKCNARDVGFGPGLIPDGIRHILADIPNKNILPVTDKFQPSAPLKMNENEWANWQIDLHKKGLLK